MYKCEKCHFTSKRIFDLRRHEKRKTPCDTRLNVITTIDIDNQNIIQNGQNIIQNGQNIIQNGQNIIQNGQNIIQNGQNINRDVRMSCVSHPPSRRVCDKHRIDLSSHRVCCSSVLSRNPDDLSSTA
jgi:hypothetical protein